MDWDIGQPGICHEEDNFLEDPPQEVLFYVFKNGDIASRFPVLSYADIYLYEQGGKLLQSYPAPSWNPFSTRRVFKPAFTLAPDREPIDLGPTESFY